MIDNIKQTTLHPSVFERMDSVSYNNPTLNARSVWHMVS
jgi:hypothetical protein